MIQLPPSEFTYGKYNSHAIPWIALKSADGYVKWLLAQNIVGFCNSMEIDIRPRENEIAVMFEEDGWQGWCHIPIDIWQAFLEK